MDANTMYSKLLNRIDYLHNKYDLPKYEPKHINGESDEEDNDNEEMEAEKVNESSMTNFGFDKNQFSNLNSGEDADLIDATSHNFK